MGHGAAERPDQPAAQCAVPDPDDYRHPAVPFDRGHIHRHRSFHRAAGHIIGGGGLGKIAINYGYYRFNVVLEFFATALLVVLVQILQTAGTKLAVKCDKRIQK